MNGYNATWRSTTKRIYLSVIVIAILTIATICINYYTNWILLNRISGFDIETYQAMVVHFDYLWSVIMLLCLISYTIYWLLINKLRPMLSSPDSAAIKKVRTGILIFLTGLIYAVIPSTVMGSTETLARIYHYTFPLMLAATTAGLIFMICGFSKLRSSVFLSSKARIAFTILKAAAIVLVIGHGLSLIFFSTQFLLKSDMVKIYALLRTLNILIVYPVKIIGMILLALGWAKVKNSPAPQNL